MNNHYPWLWCPYDSLFNDWADRLHMSEASEKYLNEEERYDKPLDPKKKWPKSNRLMQW